MRGARSGPGIERSADNGLTWTTVTKQAADAIVATPTTIYAMQSFPIHGPFEPHIQHSTDRTGDKWVDVPKPEGMTNGAKVMATTFDGKNHIIVAGYWSGGLWRYIEPASVLPIYAFLARCAATLARLPQTAILHQRRA